MEATQEFGLHGDQKFYWLSPVWPWPMRPWLRLDFFWPATAG